MPGQAPLIDGRAYGDLVAEVETLAQQYTAGEVEASEETLTGAVLDQDILDGAETIATAGTVVDAALAGRISGIEDLGPVRVKGWQPSQGSQGSQGSPDAGSALVRIFSRMAELAIARLNQVPHRDFLAFLDLIGTRPAPPQPARVPLTFHLAAGSPVDALVPARTQVAATPLEGETAPVLFETERDLVVTRSELTAIFTREPGRDLYRDSTALAAGQTGALFQAFRGDKRSAHHLYLGHAGLLGMPEDKILTIWIQTGASSAWLEDVAWESWDGQGWRLLAAVLQRDKVSRVTLPQVPAIPVSEVGGVESAWLRARYRKPLANDELSTASDGSVRIRRTGLIPDTVLSYSSTDGAVRVDSQGLFYPFGKDELRPDLYLSVDEAFGQELAEVEIEILLDETQPPHPSPPLQILWEFLGADEAVPTEFIPAAPVTPPARSEAFLVSGTVLAAVPVRWKPQSVDGLLRRWIRVRILWGSFDGHGAFAPPVVKRLKLHSTWTLPEITSLEMSAHITALLLPEEQTLPESGFANQAPIDLSKDFLPFGEKPKIGDVLYLAHDGIFSKPGAEVSLDLELTSLGERGVPPPAVASQDLVLAWEFWDGRRWQLLGNSGPGAAAAGGGGGKEKAGASPSYTLSDGTSAFTKEGPVSFLVPASLAPVDVNGERRHWIRIRIAAGNYGVEARYNRISSDGVAQYELIPATFKPPSIRSVRMRYHYDSPVVKPERLLTENDFRFQKIHSVGESSRLVPFLPMADVRPTLYLGFGRPGDRTGFANRMVTLYFGVSGALYEPAAAQTEILEEAIVVWEYWNGDRWQRLGTRDETRGFTRRGLVTFIGPPDLHGSIDFGQWAFWLRARWENGSYAMAPELRSILTNTMWAVHARTIEEEILGSSRGERGQTFRTVQSPVLEGQRLEVLETEMPPAADREELEREEGADAVRKVQDAAGRLAEVRVRWHEVPDFYGSGPRSRHYSLDPLTGEIRFGDGHRGLVPPPGRNNVRMAIYRTGGGLAGNRPAGNILQLRGTVPYVDSVLQQEPAEGGAAEESLSMLEVRGPRSLRHRDRAVALADFEDLALEATTAVARARCIPARGGPDSGTVGLIVVPRSAEPKPVPTLELLGRVRAYLEARLSPVVDLWVVGPDWLEVTVEAEIVPRVLEAATDVQTEVLERLSAFLHPLTGGFDGAGWAFGRKPYRSDLYALIEGMPGVDHVRRLEVTEVEKEGGARAERFLVYSGEHRVTVTGNTDESAAGMGSLA